MKDDKALEKTQNTQNQYLKLAENQDSITIAISFPTKWFQKNYD